MKKLRSAALLLLLSFAALMAAAGTPTRPNVVLTRVPQLEQEVKIVSEESGFSSGAVYEES